LGALRLEIEKVIVDLYPDFIHETAHGKDLAAVI
jgi:hypothetical protein